MRLIRVFPRRTKATPTDALVRFGGPDLLDEADEIHVSVTFTADKAKAERLAEQWARVAPTKIGGVAYGDTSLEFIPGRYIRPGYTITSRGCPRKCWFCDVWKKWPTPNPLPIYKGALTMPEQELEQLAVSAFPESTERAARALQLAEAAYALGEKRTLEQCAALADSRRHTSNDLAALFRALAPPDAKAP